MPLPEVFVGVGVTEHTGAQLPLDLPFRDHTGKLVKLGDYFDGKRPVILTLNYYRCPQLCTLQLNSMVDTLRDLDWQPGQQYRILTISFDPLEPPELAAAKRRSYLDYFNRPEAVEGWHFLVGRKQSIDSVLETTGFGVRFDPSSGEWAHAAALILCTPDGRISRYLVNVTYEPRTVRLSLVEASEGKVGSPLDHIMLFCFHFDGEGYALSAFRVAQVGGGMTAVSLGIFLTVLWWRERRRRAKVVMADL